MTVKRVIVFGATGFLGRRVVAALAEAGIEVGAASRHPPRVGANDGPGEPVTADITDPASVARALEGAAAAVNCVSLYAESGGGTFQSVHVGGARTVAATAAAAGAAALVHISGIGSDPSSRSPYVRARGEGEAAVLDAFPAATILRPGVMFGPGDAFLTAIARIAAMSPIIPLFGSGGTRLQPVLADDVAAAVRHVVGTPSARGAAFELGGPEVLTYRAIIGRVLEWTGRRRLLLPFPFAGWDALAVAARLLPSPPLTEGQVALMKRDNVVSPDARTFSDLGIAPRPMTEVAPDYL